MNKNKWNNSQSVGNTNIFDIYMIMNLATITNFGSNLE